MLKKAIVLVGVLSLFLFGATTALASDKEEVKIDGDKIEIRSEIGGVETRFKTERGSFFILSNFIYLASFIL